eukprot:3375603-Pyramimonas_sp.AAC.1
MAPKRVQVGRGAHERRSWLHVRSQVGKRLPDGDTFAVQAVSSHGGGLTMYGFLVSMTKIEGSVSALRPAGPSWSP